MFSHKTEEIRPIFGAPVNFFLLYFVTQITQITQIFPSSISYSVDETCSVRLRRFFLQLYLVTQIFFAVFFLVPQISQIYTDFSLVPNLRNPRPNRSKICVICEICVTFFSRPSRPKICVHLWNLWDSKNFNLRDLKNNQSAGLVLAGTPSGKYKVPQITQICTDFSHAFSHTPLGFFLNGAEWAWERRENLENDPTIVYLCTRSWEGWIEDSGGGG